MKVELLLVVPADQAQEGGLDMVHTGITDPTPHDLPTLLLPHSMLYSTFITVPSGGTCVLLVQALVRIGP